jgi:hypothetical protein
VGHSVEKESIKEPREDVARFSLFCKDRQCQQYVLLAIENYAECLYLDLKHVYQALPKLLSLWFDIVSAQAPENVSHAFQKHRIGETPIRKSGPCSHLVLTVALCCMQMFWWTHKWKQTKSWHQITGESPLPPSTQRFPSLSLIFLMRGSRQLQC